MNTVDLENELKNNQAILEKVKDEVYAQNLYAALCNTDWYKGEELWGCTWRYAGGLVAELRDQSEDYMDFYCSGIPWKEEEKEWREKGYAYEGEVKDRIKEDLALMGWRPEAL